MRARSKHQLPSSCPTTEIPLQQHLTAAKLTCCRGKAPTSLDEEFKIRLADSLLPNSFNLNRGDNGKPLFTCAGAAFCSELPWMKNSREF